MLWRSSVIFRNIAAWSSPRGDVCAARKVFLRMNLLWWRGPELRHWGKSISASGDSGDLAAYCGVWSIRTYDAAGVCGWAAQAEAEVERSEGEGEAQGRPVLGWAICRRLGVSAAGCPGVVPGTPVPRLHCWMVWRRRSVRGTSREGAGRGEAEAG